MKSRYALLLRGINVGTKNSLPMTELRAMLEATGATDVVTYVQSGNAVFGSTKAPEALRRAVEKSLAAYMGRPIDTTLRTREELTAIVAGNPFGALADDPAKLCVTFLAEPPGEAGLAPLLARDWGRERFHVAGREIYTWHPEGQGKSELAKALGKLKVRGALTTRNWNTVQKLLALL